MTFMNGLLNNLVQLIIIHFTKLFNFHFKTIVPENWVPLFPLLLYAGEDTKGFFDLLGIDTGVFFIFCCHSLGLDKFFMMGRVNGGFNGGS